MESSSDLIAVPLCLLPDEQKDPQLALTRLFEETDLEYFKIHLWHFLKAVFSEHYFRLMGQPAIVCDIVEHLELIIDTFYILSENNRKEEVKPIVNRPEVYDSSDADREYMINVSKIYRSHNGHIRRLGKGEVENLDVVAQNFFRFYSRNEWLEELKRWQYYALGNFSICAASDETRILDMYEHLEKLLEAAYLLHQRGTMQYNCAEQESKISFSKKKKPHGIPAFLSIMEQNEPFVYICNYFGSTTLSEHTRELSGWIQAIFGDYVWNLHDPGELVFFYEETVKLVEAAFELYSERESGAEWIEGTKGYNMPMPVRLPDLSALSGRKGSERSLAGTKGTICTQA